MRKIKIAAAVLGALAVISAAACSTTEAGDATSSPPPVNGSAAPSGPQTGARDTDSAGRKVYQAGDTGKLTRDGKDVGTVTVSKPRAIHAHGDTGPVPGTAIDITILAAADLAGGGLEYNIFDWHMRAADGSQVDTSFVPSEYESREKAPELGSGTLAAGQRAQGTLVYVGAPASFKGARLEYAPGLEAIAYWQM